MPAPLELSAGFQKPILSINFDKKVLKRGMRDIGKEVRVIARKLVSAHGVSKPGGYPGRETGVLRGSIIAKVSKSGFSVAIQHNTKSGKAKSVFEKKGFYPAFVYYGHVGPHSALKTKKGKRSRKIGDPSRKVVKPRGNYIVNSVEAYGTQKLPEVMRKILENALKPGVIK